ncbi:iron ABC transporter permease [Coprothermobacteraceae bacterium]|nr:iron ABC transporter permease [Coprothermobacteraceae bacterium]
MILIAIVYLLAVVFSIALGQIEVNFLNPTADQIAVMAYRWQRAIAASIAGVVLAASALTLQTVTRNNLVDSGIIGVNAGAVLGKVLALYYGLRASLPMSLIGSLMALSITLLLGYARGSDILRLVVAGIVVNSALSSAISLITLYLYTSASAVLSWTLGHIRLLSAQEWYLLTVSAVLTAFLLFRHRQLDLLTLSQDEARSLGLDYRRETAVLLVASSIAAALISSVFGVLSFVGVIAPNLARRVSEGTHIHLFMYSITLGATLMVLADLMARTLIKGIEVPTGLLVSFVGAAFYLYFFWRASIDKHP